MKHSSAIVLSVVPALAAACGSSAPPPDPCLPATYSMEACQYAVEHRGYYYGGTWYPHVYPQPFFFYNNAYTGYIARGGRVTPIEAGRYSPALSRGGSAVGGTTTRGGFGSSGAARAAAGAGFSSGG